jgi:GPH family glycoside/pentoside/hexuronide:cation symporter
MKNIMQYSLIAMPLAFAGVPLYLYAPDYYTRDLGMSLGLLGIILLALRLFDAIQDPVIGYMSDKYSQHRTLIIAIGLTLLTLGLSITLLGVYAFLPLPIWFFLGVLFAVTGFSIVSININMIGGFVSNDSTQRTRYSAWREAFMLLGLLIAVILPTAMQQQGVNVHHSLQITLAVFIGLLLIILFGFFAFLKNNPQSNDTMPVRFSIKKLFINSQSNFFVICGLSQFAAALPAVLVLFFIKDYLQAEEYTGVFLLAYFAAGAALMPVWVTLADKIGKAQSWRISMILACATFIWAFTLTEGDIIAFGIICVLSGLAFGADLALPPALLADRLSSASDRDGGTAKTSYYATLSFISKAALGLAGGITFLLLDLSGFEAGSKDNSATALNTLIVLYALIPCLIKAGSIWALTRMINGEKETNETKRKNRTQQT